MRLDQLLGGLSVDQLQELMAAWAPEERTSRSKLEMFRALRTRMVEPERARHCLDQTGALGRGMVRRLLRSDGMSQTVAVLAVSSAGRPRSVQETRGVAAELASMGLVAVEGEKRWETYGSARVTIPDELAGSLRTATGVDERTWREVLSLEGYVESRGREALLRDLKRAGVAWAEGRTAAEVAGALAEREACAARTAKLSERLRTTVTSALSSHAGILPLGAGPRGLTDEEDPPDERTLANWRKELESHFIGTIGDVSLLEYGIDLDGRVLAVFGEVAESLATAPDAAEPRCGDPVGPDFALDLLELAAVVRESGAKLKGSGELTGAAAERISGRLNRAALPLMNATELMELRLACAERLGLVERGEESLVIGRTAWRWERKGYEERAADLFALVGSAAPAPRSKHHHEGLCEAAREVLRGMEPGAWQPGGAVESVTIRRYLARLESSGLRERISSAVREVAEYVLPPFPGLRQLQADVREAVVLEAYAMGLLDLAVDGKRVIGERLSEFGAAATGRAASCGAGALLVTPDFEVILLPEGDVTRLRHEVGRFAAREKFDRTVHLRIRKERVEEAVVRGLSADEMIGALRAHSHAGVVPQNVEASIRGWAGRVRVATVEAVCLLEVPDDKLLDVVAEMPGVKERVLRRISGTALALSEWPEDRRVLAELRRLGVFVR